MSKSIKITKSKFADDLNIKSQKININGKKFKTPIKSVDMSNLRRDVSLNKNIKGINEVFRTFNKNSLDEYTDGKKNETENIFKNLSTKTRKTLSNEVNMCFILYESPNLPTEEKHVNFLMNISYTFSDATPLPLLSSFFDETKEFKAQFEQYMEFMKKCIESINRLNNKPIIGIIPFDIPSMFVPILMDFYYSYNITSFVYDFKGRVYVGNEGKLRELMISLNDLDISDKTFLYSTNVNPGKMLKGAPIIRATDVLIYNFGFDVIGDNHIRKKFPPDLVQKMKERTGPKSIRLFNSQNYGYYKTMDLDVLNDMYPQDETSIPFETFKVDNAKSKQCQKLFNTERIGLEASKYQEMISENIQISEYLSTKNILSTGVENEE